jgi:formylglycine-generating enzyme required for sulfatase activity
VTWLCEQTKAKYRLPSEAEWEYAARAGSETAFWWGDEIQTYGDNVRRKSLLGFPQLFGKRTTEVGSFPGNAFGIHDTSGNVFEWTNDCWHNDYSGAPNDGSAWREADGGDCSLRVLRGGSWDVDQKFLRSAARHKFHPGLRYPHVGFRVVRDL